MKITLCIDKQQRGNPSEELKQYSIDIGCPLRSVDEIFDELKINTNDNNSLEGKIIRRCYVDKYGVLKKLDKAETQTLEIPAIELFEGTNYVYILEYTNLNMKIEYLTNAEMNKYFATKMEMNSTIQQTYDSIVLSVSKDYVGKNKVIAEINMSEEEITILANKLGITANDVLNIIAGNEINLTSKNITINSDNFKVDKSGKMTATSAILKGDYSKDTTFIMADGGDDYKTKINPGLIKLGDENDKYVNVSSNSVTVFDSNKNNNSEALMINIVTGGAGGIYFSSPDDTASSGSDTNISRKSVFAKEFVQASLESLKEDFEIFNEALALIEKSDIYRYYFKGEEKSGTKHIGLVIPNQNGNFRTPNEIISKNGKSIDIYSMTSVAWQAIKEQQQIIEELKKEIEVLKNELRKN